MLNDITINDKPIKSNRALISVYDKTNFEKIAQTLIKQDCEILSNGSTAEF